LYVVIVHNKPAEIPVDKLVQLLFVLAITSIGSFALVVLFIPVPFQELEPLKLLLAVIVGIIPIIVGLKVIQSYTSGIIGEKKVAEELTRLPDRYHAFFNVYIKDSGDIDAVVVGPTGVFAIEVKRIAGGTLFVKDDQWYVKTSHGVRPLSTDPVSQVKRAATFLHKSILGTWVDAVVALVDCRSEVYEHRSVRILKAEELPAFISNRPMVLGERSIKEIVEKLENYIKATQIIR